MVDYVQSHLTGLWLTLGFVLLVIEMLAFGFSTGVLLFCGIGALLTGLLLWSGIVPGGWLASIAVFTLLSAISTVLLWRPMKRMQNSAELGHDKSSDLIGHEFRLEQAVGHGKPGKTRFSGIDWRVVPDDTVAGDTTLQAGQKVVVTRVEAGVFHVGSAA